MMPQYAFNLHKDGTSQSARLLPALQADYFRVDERSFSDLMAWALKYAQLLQHTNLDNVAEGDWQAFFASDEAFVLSAILAVDLDVLETDFEHYLFGIASSSQDTATIPPLLVMVQMLDGWYQQLGKLQSVAALRMHDKMVDVIENTLRGKFTEIAHWWQQQGNNCPALSVIWFDVAQALSTYDDEKQFLKSCFNAFYNALLLLQGCAEEVLRVALQRKNHDPALALYMAFLKLFAKVQGKINDFSQRHLQFYYQQVLKIQRQPFSPASVHLLFVPDVIGREVWIEQGTEFKAGLDENQLEHLFVSDNDLRVTDAQVADLYTLCLTRNTRNFPENALRDHAQSSFVTAARLNQHTSGNFAPLFTEPRHAHYAPARMGLAIASQTLFMQQGERVIELSFRFQAGALDRFVSELSTVLATRMTDAFFKTFRSMFHIELTGAQGWLEVVEYLPLCHSVDEQCAPDCLVIRVVLPDSYDAVVGYKSALHGEAFDTHLPIMKLCLNPDGYLYAYSLLSEMSLLEVLVEVSVQGCTDVQVYNQLGQLSGAVQFNPFGPLPILGDYLVLGCYEAACKQLTDFSVDVQWGGLPMHSFEHYYRAYGMAFNTDIFKANLSVLKDRKWQPRDMSLSCSLFKTQDVQHQRISFQPLCNVLRPLENVSVEQYKYDNTAKDGFFKLTLANPPYAFGHKDYPLVLSSIMSENASLKRFRFSKLLGKKLPQKVLPNPAYTPLVQSIRVNYRAVSHISLESTTSHKHTTEQDKLLHLHPLGYEYLSGKTQHHCLPRWSADGNLLIGLRATDISGLLTLFFHLRADSMPGAATETFAFEWHYLADNSWRKIEQSQCLSDTTCGFLTSGLVTLNIPEDINQQNTILPNDRYWLKVSSNHRQLHTLCSLYAVYPHALKATWQPQSGNALMTKVLPAGTIKESKKNIVGIREIRQLMDSFAGIPPESEQQQIIRVSERLHHKNRAIQPWDYERLVLQQFSYIQKVKCFPCMDGQSIHAQRARPGHVLLVVIPQQTAEQNWQPMVNALLLNEIRSYIQNLASANVTVHVRNPLYEQIQVRCKVKLRSSRGRGLYHNELNQEIIQYLSPWNDNGLGAKFGWRIRCDEIQAHIQRMSYVESAAGLSLLQIHQGDDALYALGDTARTSVGSVLKPSYPWSIAIPATQHLIEIFDENGVWHAEPTGIAKLAIGSTFILSKENS